MIVLDTNVISALMLSDAKGAVVDWLDRQDAGSIWTTAITVFELQLGVTILPAGKRRKLLAERMERLIDESLEGRILDVTRPAASRAGELVGRLRSKGIQIEIRDALIAGIVSDAGATLATRNTRHFRDCGIEMVDPWTVAG